MAIRELLSDASGVLSSKRVVTVVSALLIAVGFLANLFGGYKIDEFIFNAVMYIVIAGFGFTGMEKFAPKGDS